MIAPIDAPASGPVPWDKPFALKLLADMVRIRRMEERCAELYGQQKIRGFLHLYVGEEAVAVGALNALRADDNLVATYREHGHALVRGMPMTSIMAEMYGKREGCARGRGGSMHLFDRSTRLYGGNAIVGGGLPVATGLALADRMQGRRALTACFFGDGAVAEGAFHESLNLAALWKLPVLFCCENNLYAMGTAIERYESQTDLCVKASSYGMPAIRVDGMDVVAIHEATQAAAELVRDGGGPMFIEFRTYRFRAHSMFDAELYRSKNEVEAVEDARADPRLHGAAQGAGQTDRGRVPGDRRGGAGRGRRGGRVRRSRHLGAGRRPAEGRDDAGRGGRAVSRTISYREALREALQEALRADPRVFLMGEDVGRYGGTYAVSKGLLRGVRARAHPRHAAVGARLRRRRHRRGDGRRASDRRDHDGQLQPAGARPDRQHRRRDAAHVRRPVLGAAGGPHGDRRRPPGGGPALAQPRELVRPRARTDGAGARDGRGCPRHAQAGAGRSRSRRDLRARAAVQPAGRAARRFLPRHPGRAVCAARGATSA